VDELTAFSSFNRPCPPSINDEGYVVLHRPYAFKQWLEKYADTIEEEYVLMSEPDHLYLRGMPLLVGAGEYIHLGPPTNFNSTFPLQNPKFARYKCNGTKFA